MRQNKKHVFFVGVVTLFLLMFASYSLTHNIEEIKNEKQNNGLSEDKTNTLPSAVLDAQECFASELKHMQKKSYYWFQIPALVEKCGKSIRKFVPFIDGTPEYYERKYYLIPLLESIHDPCSVITFGIGGDIETEKFIRMIFPHCTFVGFDPNPDYKSLFVDDLKGKFEATAVSGKTGNTTIFQLKKLGKYEEVPGMSTRSGAELIEEYHGSDHIIDILNIDVEGAEFSIFEQMLNEKIYENVCQFNVELHPVWYYNMGYSYVEAMEVMKKLMESGTFMWVENFIHNYQFFCSFFINIKNEKCIKKYLKGRLF